MSFDPREVRPGDPIRAEAWNEAMRAVRSAHRVRGDGKVNAYNLNTKKFVGQLAHRKGQPLQFDGLWALLFVENRLYFTAGINHEADGLFGFIVPAAREDAGGF